MKKTIQILLITFLSLAFTDLIAQPAHVREMKSGKAEMKMERKENHELRKARGHKIRDKMKADRKAMLDQMHSRRDATKTGKPISSPTPDHAPMPDKKYEKKSKNDHSGKKSRHGKYEERHEQEPQYKEEKVSKPQNEHKSKSRHQGKARAYDKGL